ncbi:unnamed protein product [Rotaria sp. Silwood2]|nr:unnamed protein product [Rotaria sp. Silwood2]CAF4697662.1 unnamed protein product [Rotaria sp. Silwood2]
MATASFNRLPATCEFTHIDQNLENFTIVWLDATTDQRNDNLYTKARLRTVVNHLKTFQDVETCIKHLLSIENEKVLLIISGSLADMYNSVAHPISQVEAIYIFCLVKTKYKMLLISQKIRGIFTNEGTYSTVKSLLDRACAQTIGLSELLKALEWFGFTAFCCRVMGLLLDFGLWA